MPVLLPATGATNCGSRSILVPLKPHLISLTMVDERSSAPDELESPQGNMLSVISAFDHILKVSLRLRFWPKSATPSTEIEINAML